MLPSFSALASPWPAFLLEAQGDAVDVAEPDRVNDGAVARADGAAPMPVVASPIAMLTFSPMVLQTTVPCTAWSLPSMVTVLLPSAEAAEDVSPPVSDFFSDEQPAGPGDDSAAPPTATTNPRFTMFSFMLSRTVKIGGPSQRLSSTAHLGS